MTAGGLFVPLSEHTEAFCRSAEWDQCLQYIRGCEAFLAMTRERRSNQTKGRRLHPRFIRRHSLTLAAASLHPGQPGERFEQNAWTVDLGLGGMRVETSAALPEAAKVFFAFGDDFMHPGLSGIAEVRWQRADNAAGMHQCGLGFIGHDSSRLIGESLGLA